ncbi:fluoride export protein 1-like isoform X2 [Bradysia coprophila]|uniref:fluoride export protein 1-like isoform X2 n=1 Tax=Bradysia coprophila TaxID=38358 RepID=UPI00187D9715|nr:fluoride export protein 1-like isoform X2 [Bradysia coprophila]XP_037037313.1 fluoride export protein 1-like isoform X2 [Bradysia coprophila]XP_037037314.1 fluoride export protein 1-like isoform X2 [Bradysia coprophila]
MVKKASETLCCIILFTYFGTLTRMVLSYLSQTSDSHLMPVFISSFFLANIVGSFIMGLFVPLDKLFSPSYTSWHVGVTTGFCGSCTTFSTWQRITAEKLAHGQIVDGIMTLLFTFCTSYGAFIFGKHIGDAIFHRPVRCFRGQRFGEVSVTITNTDMATTHVEQGISSSRYVYLWLVTVFVTVAIWIAVLLDTSSEDRRKCWTAAALGPIGSLARYFLLLNNRKRPTFPLFTFIVNVCASVVSAVILAVFVRLSSENEHWSTYNLWLNFGVGAGILGCLSTVSTFVNELRKLADTKIVHAYRYGLTSVIVSQIFCIFIICTTFFK